MATGRESRRSGSGTREALIQATVVLIERDGVAAVTVRRVAEEAGLPAGTVHYWFASKEALLSAALDELLQQVRDAPAEDINDESVEARLIRLHREFVEMPVGRQLALFEFTLHAVRSPELQEAARAQYAAYAAAAATAIAPWREAVETLPGGEQALAALVVAVIDGLTLAELVNPGAPGQRAALGLFAHLLPVSTKGAGQAG